jgi:hypothetical protein
VGVEKLRIPQNIENLEDRKCLGKSRTSFVEHPDAILFLRISREGVFQQPRDFSPTGTARKGTLDVPLLAWSAGVYYLVFENRSATKTPKSIQANFILTYSGMWWPGKTE